MNHRVVVIVLVASFATCFVCSGALATLAIINAAVGSAPEVAAVTAPRPTPPEPEKSVAPRVTPPEPDEELTDAPPTEDDEDLTPPEEDEPAAEFDAPLIGTGEFAVFHPEKSKMDPFAALQKAAKGTKVKVFKNLAPVSASPPYLELRDLPVTEYAVIAGNTLEAGRGLTPADKLALPRSKRVSVVDAAMPLGASNLLEVSRVIAAFAQHTGGVLWDEEAQEYLSHDAWKTRRLDSWEKGVPHVSLNFTVFVDTEGKEVGVRSAGMKHFGLPELELKNIPKLLKDDGVALLNATAQILAEQKGPVKPGPLKVSLAAMRHVQHRKNLVAKTYPNADKVVDVVLVPGANTKTPTLAITFTGPGTSSEKVETALATLFGTEE